jgi:hypothetical protein
MNKRERRPVLLITTLYTGGKKCVSPTGVNGREGIDGLDSLSSSAGDSLGKGGVDTKSCEGLQPVLFGTCEKSTLSSLEDLGVNTNGRGDAGDSARHILEQLIPALSFGPLVVGKRHEPDETAAKGLDLSARTPRYKFYGKAEIPGRTITNHEETCLGNST